MRVGICEWLAWLLRMHREPEVDLVTSRPCIRRHSTRAEDLSSSYSIHGHLANVCETNGDNNSRDEWPPRRRSISLSRRESTRFHTRKCEIADEKARDPRFEGFHLGLVTMIRSGSDFKPHQPTWISRTTVLSPTDSFPASWKSCVS